MTAFDQARQALNHIERDMQRLQHQLEQHVARAAALYLDTIRATQHPPATTHPEQPQHGGDARQDYVNLYDALARGTDPQTLLDLHADTRARHGQT